jgi:hypothetical protein
MKGVVVWSRVESEHDVCVVRAAVRTLNRVQQKVALVHPPPQPHHLRADTVTLPSKK